MVHRTTPWSKSYSDTFDVDDGGCLGCCCSSCAFFFSSIIFWAVDLLTPVSAAVLSHTRFIDSFIPGFFISMQNVYTFSIIQVALHVHYTPNYVVFFCKHVNREKFPASLRKQKIKNNKRFYWGSNTQPWAQALNFVFRLFEYNRYTNCAIESLVKFHL